MRRMMFHTAIFNDFGRKITSPVPTATSENDILIQFFLEALRDDRNSLDNAIIILDKLLERQVEGLQKDFTWEYIDEFNQVCINFKIGDELASLYYCDKDQLVLASLLNDSILQINPKELRVIILEWKEYIDKF